MISVKLTERGSIVTIYNPKQKMYFFRPLHLSEIDIIREYGESTGLDIILNNIVNKNLTGKTYG